MPSGCSSSRSVACAIIRSERSIRYHVRAALREHPREAALAAARVEDTLARDVAEHR